MRSRASDTVCVSTIAVEAAPVTRAIELPAMESEGLLCSTPVLAACVHPRRATNTATADFENRLSDICDCRVVLPQSLRQGPCHASGTQTKTRGHLPARSSCQG